MNEIRTLLDDLAGDPPADLDLDQLITRGRRRSRLRNLGAGTLAAVLVAGCVGTVLAISPGGGESTQPLASPTMTPKVRIVRPGDTPHPDVTAYQARSTELSKALAAQLRTLAPEYAAARFTPSNGQQHEGDKALRWLTAGYAVTDPRFGNDLPTLDVEIAAPGTPKGLARPLDVICTSMQPVEGPCVGTPRRLEDGSNARVYSRAVQGTRRYAVLIVKPDGVRIIVDGGIMWTDEIKQLPDLGPDRLIAIGQAITVRP